MQIEYNLYKPICFVDRLCTLHIEKVSKRNYGETCENAEQASNSGSFHPEERNLQIQHKKETAEIADVWQDRGEIDILRQNCGRDTKVLSAKIAVVRQKRASQNA